jgi:hypothetical protein
MIVGSYFSVTWIGFKEYVKLLILSVPLDVYIALILLWIIAVVISFLLKNWKKSIPLLSQLFFLEYVFLVFCSTVIYREIFEGSSVHLEPFWSYFDKESGMFVLRAEHILNILVFIPIGFCMFFFIRSMRYLNLY